MLLSGIKKISASFSSLFKGKKTQGSGYMKSELPLHLLSGQGGQQNGQYPGQRSRLSRLQRAWATRKTNQYQGYKPAGNNKKTIFKLTALATVGSILLVFLLVGGGQLILEKLESVSFFQVSEIVFSGTRTIPEDNLRVVSKIVLHQTSLLGLDCSQIEQWLAAVPWVAKAEVTRNWPSTVEISIVENVPVALLHSGDASGEGLQYIDKTGTPFLRVGPGGELDYPVVSGLMGIGDPVLRKKALAQALVLLKKISRKKNVHLPPQSVSEVHLTPEGEMVVYLVEHPFPIFFGRSYTYDKYVRLVRVLKSIYKKDQGEGSISEIEYIQMDYLPDQVLVAESVPR